MLRSMTSPSLNNFQEHLVLPVSSTMGFRVHTIYRHKNAINSPSASEISKKKKIIARVLGQKSFLVESLSLVLAGQGLSFYLNG